MKLDKTTKIARSPKVIFHEDESGLVALLDTAKEEVLHLNETASFVWKLLKTPQSLGQIVEKVTKEFDRAQEKAVTKDLEQLTKELSKREAITIKKN